MASSQLFKRIESLTPSQDHFLWLSSLALLRLDNNSTATTTEEYYNGAQAYLSFISSEFASLVILLLLEAARKLGLERFEPNTTA